MIIIKAEYAALIQPFVSNEETRYYLCGFHVERHHDSGVFIVATDGHSLGCFHDEDGIISATRGADLSAIIDVDAATLKACKAARGERGTRYLVIPDSGSISVVSANSASEAADSECDERIVQAIQAAPAIIDGTFPDWRRIVPRLDAGEPHACANYNVKYLAKYSKLTTAIRVIADSDTGPALVLTDRADFFGVVMPMRGGAGVDVPGWLRPRPQPQVETA